MSKTIRIRNLTIGPGTPKIIVPIAGVTKEEILSLAERVKDASPDLIEWRADWYEDTSEFDKVKDILRCLRKVMGEIPILFTFRSAGEGGEKNIDRERYASLNRRAASSGIVDLIDVESGEMFDADTLDTMTEAELARLRDLQSLAKQSGEYKYVCAVCGQPLRLNSPKFASKQYRSYFFSHYSNGGDCPLKTRSDALDPIQSTIKWYEQFKESGLHRDMCRKLMDVVISQYDRNYLDSLNRYNKALQQRNSLLKLEEEPDVALLEIWEEQMAREGEFLYSKRDEFINLLSPLFQQIYQRISEDKEKVSLRYVSHCQRGPLLEVIQRDRAKDRIMGYSLHGVHRDDLEMMLGDYPMKREGSQGQNKTFVAALKLAQLQFLKTKVGTAPLLLLDDIFDKLDAHRVEQIIRLVGTEDFGQIFITDTNRSHIDKILQGSGADYRLFEVTQGKISDARN